MNKILLALLGLICISLEVYRNYYLIIKQKIRPNYRNSNIFRAYLLFALNILYTGKIAISIEYTFLLIMMFAVFFDPALAKAEGKPLFYINRTAQSSWYDRILNKIGPFYQLYLFAEFIFLLMAIDMYIIGWDNFKDQVTGNYNWNNWIW